MKGAELHLHFNGIHSYMIAESQGDVPFADEVLEWLETKDSPLAAGLGVGVCLMVGIFLVGQVLRYVLA